MTGPSKDTTTPLDSSAFKESQALELFRHLVRQRHTLAERAKAAEAERKQLDEQIQELLRDHGSSATRLIAVGESGPRVLVKLQAGSNSQLSKQLLVEKGVALSIIEAATVKKQYWYIQTEEVKNKEEAG